MARGEMKSPRPPRFPTNRRNGDRSVSTQFRLDPEVRERAKLASLGGHLDDGRRELVGALKDADALGDSVVWEMVAQAISAVDDARATLAEHGEVDYA